MSAQTIARPHQSPGTVEEAAAALVAHFHLSVAQALAFGRYTPKALNALLRSRPVNSGTEFTPDECEEIQRQLRLAPQVVSHIKKHQREKPHLVEAPIL